MDKFSEIKLPSFLLKSFISIINDFQTKNLGTISARDTLKTRNYKKNHMPLITRNN